MTDPVVLTDVLFVEKPYFDSLCGSFSVPWWQHEQLRQYEADLEVLGDRAAWKLMGGYLLMTPRPTEA